MSELRRFVIERARDCCEYCRLPRRYTETPFQIDHVVAQKHHGETDPDNLCWACFYCNSYKGPNLSGLNPETGRAVRLFSPRRDRWTQHFEWDGSRLIGKTPTGRVTIDVLRLNAPLLVQIRELLIECGVFPPP